MNGKLWLCAASALVLATGAQAKTAPAPEGPATPHFGTWGFNLAGRDMKVKPGDDFFQYADGTYVDDLTIPADKSRWGAFNALAELSNARVHTILESEASRAGEHPTTDAGKIGAFYKAFMDEQRVNALGAKPLAPALAAVKAADSRDALAAIMGKASSGFQFSLFGGFISPDAKDPSRYAVYVTQAGLGMPDRDYYLLPTFAKQRTAYEAYIAKLLTLSDWPEPEANAKAILAFETKVAEASWTGAERRDRDKTYNPMSVAALKSLAPGFDWTAFLKGADLGATEQVVVREKSAMPKLAQIYAETPVPVLQAWEAFHIADEASPYLSTPFVQARFEFRDKTLSGQPEEEVRWKRAVNAVGDLRAGMGEAVGKIYVARYFPPSSKLAMEKLVSNLKDAFHARIEKLDWMSPGTKKEALEKLANYTIKIGYTTDWRDYSGLQISGDDLYGDAERSLAANYDYQLKRLHKPVDRAEWHMTPQTVNAYNNSSLNEVVFPAAILQPPFFDPKADPAVNYGGIGAVIGHEMTHGFDDQGRKVDAQGRLRDWWTAEDAAKFNAKAQRYGAEYAAYTPIPDSDIRIRPALTMGENIADLGGLNMALDAYHASLHGKPAPVIGGYTGDQRVFLGWAQVWAGKSREDALRRQLVSNPHSPDKYRAQTPERNMEAWYKAFDVTPGEKLYIAPADRVHIW